MPNMQGALFCTIEDCFVGNSGRPDESVGAHIFERRLCLPSDNKMTMEQVDVICEIVRGCFG